MELVYTFNNLYARLILIPKFLYNSFFRVLNDDSNYFLSDYIVHWVFCETNKFYVKQTSFV